MEVINEFEGVENECNGSFYLNGKCVFKFNCLIIDINDNEYLLNKIMVNKIINI